MNPHKTSEKGMRYSHSLPKSSGEQMQRLMGAIKRVPEVQERQLKPKPPQSRRSRDQAQILTHPPWPVP